MARVRRAGAAARIAVATVLLLACGVAAAQRLPNPKDYTEFWPEVDVYYRLDESVRLKAYASLNESRETAYRQGSLGVELDWGARPLSEVDRWYARVTPDFIAERIASLTIGYQYTGSLGSDRGDYGAHQLQAAGTFTVRGPWGLRLRNRNRVDVRYVDQVASDLSGSRDQYWSWRYRNRTRIDRDFDTRIGVVTPYTQVEFFYDGRTHTWSRYNVYLGTIFPVWRETAFLDAYVVGQNDRTEAGTSLNNVVALGLTLKLYY